MADLPTNYLDDILAQSMNGKRKFRITRPDGTFEEVIIEDISEYSQTGSTFGAGDINRTNQAVNEKFDSEDVVDPMLTTEPGFAADAYKTKLQFDEQNKKLISTTLFDDGHTTILTYGKICILNFNNAFDVNVMPFSGYILPVHSLCPTVSSCSYYSGDASTGNKEGQLYVEDNKIFLRSNTGEIISKNYITGQIVFFVN